MKRVNPLKGFMIRKVFYISSLFSTSLFGQTNLPIEITTPSIEETRLGKLEFPLGVPAPKTVETLYDHIDYIHGINSFLTAFSGVSMWAMHEGFLKVGVKDQDVLIFSNMMDAQSLFLTGQADLLSFMSFLDLSQGPVVVEMPPQTMGFVNDMWQRWVTDVGITGPDRGLGGKYLFVPPGYNGILPEGYFIAQSRTNRVLFLGYAFLDKRDPKQVVEGIKKNFFISPYVAKEFGTSIASILEGKVLPEKMSAPQKRVEMRYVEGMGLMIQTIPPNDFTYYEKLDALVQSEPARALDPEIAGNLAAVGIVKGKPFQPDEHLKKTLSASVQHGNAVSRVLVFRPRPAEEFNFYGPMSNWVNPLFVGGYDFLTPPPQIMSNSIKPDPEDGARKLNARTAHFYVATGTSPSMAMRLTRIGLQQLATFLDNQKMPLDGAKTYRLKLPANVPASQLWSVTLYDNQTRSMLNTSQRYPRAGNQAYPTPGAERSQDGSITLYFGPEKPSKAPNGNWIQTLPEHGYFAILRLYGPLKSFFEKTWKPGEIEEMNPL